jgi:DNA-binding beta-propeller fold protein YncE
MNVAYRLHGNNLAVTNVTIEALQVVPISSPQQINLSPEGDEFSSL